MIIPSPPAEIFGRENEIKRLFAAASDKKLLIIAGIGGSGKTALASYLAGSMKSDKNKIIWLSCFKSFSRNEFLASFSDLIFKACGSSPAVLDFSGIIDTCIKQGLTVFLDDFHETGSYGEEFLHEYISEKASGLIAVTSRNRVFIPEHLSQLVHCEFLSGLDPEQSCRFLQSLEELHDFSLNTEQRNCLSKISGGHPLSLKLFSAMILTGEIFSDIRDSEHLFREQLEPLLLQNLLKKCSEQEKEALIQLSVFRIPVDFQQICRKMNFSLQTVHCLERMFLVEIEASGMLTVQDVIREWLFFQCPSDKLKIVHRNAAEYCLSHEKTATAREAFFHYIQADDVSKAAEAAIMISQKSQFSGEEVETVCEILQSAVLKASGDTAQLLLDHAASFLIFRKKFKEASQLISKIQNPSRRLDLSAFYSFHSGDFKSSKQKYNDLVSQYPENLKNPAVLAFLGHSLVCCGDFSEADKIFDSILKNIDLIPDSIVRIITILEAGRYLTVRGKISDASALFSQIRNSAVFSSVHVQASESLNAALCCYLNSDSRAAQYAQNAEKLAETVNYLEVLSDSLYLQALICLYDKNFVSAQEFTSRHGSMAESLNLKHELCRNWILQAKVLNHLFRFSEAAAFISCHSDDFSRCGDPELEIDSLLELAHSKIFLKDKSAAETILDRISKTVDKKCNIFQHFQYCYCRKLLNPGWEFSESDRNFQELSVFFQHYYAHFSTISCDAAEKNTVCINKKLQNLSDDELVILRKEKENYAFFADFLSEKLFIDGTEIKIFNKKAQMPLFSALILNPDERFNPENLFILTWGRKPHPVRDDGILRNAIHRMRKLFDASNPDRFIKKDETGNYRFSSEESFAVIFPDKKTPVGIPGS